ncbi:MAG: D-alanyl-D-alanine carboxypeptidase family protein [Bacteroidota bacterium]
MKRIKLSIKWFLGTLLSGVLLVGCAESPSSEAAEATKWQAQNGEPTTVKAVKELNVSPSDSLSKTIDTLVRKELSRFGIDYLTGKFEPAAHKDFIEIAKVHASRPGMYLRKDAYEAFRQMFEAAEKDGVRLIIKSATRNFEAQKAIWEGKWIGSRLLEGGVNAAKQYPDPKERALKILEWSSMPGTSRHHWGTDIDMNAFVNEYFETGVGLKVYQWLEANAASYGFCQPYTPKGEKRPYGYNEEKWHWSYLPVSIQLISEARSTLKDDAISGFKGAQVAPSIGVIEKYVLGISEKCL